MILGKNRCRHYFARNILRNGSSTVYCGNLLESQARQIITFEPIHSRESLKFRSFGICGRKANEKPRRPSSAVQQFSSSAVQQFSSSVMVLCCLTLTAFSQSPGPYPTEPPTHTSAGTGLWSSATTWTPVAPITTTVPLQSTDIILIQAGHTVTLDLLIDCAKAIIVDGTLIVDNNLQDWCFELLYVRNGGKLKVGTSLSPFTGNLNIRLAEDFSTSPPTPGRLFVDPGGNIRMWGNQNGQLPHGRLSETLLTGQNRIRVVGNPGWAVGDKVVVASTDYDTNDAEEFTITSVTNLPPPSRMEYGIDHPATFQHFVGTLDPGPSKTMKIAAEVGLLSRNITVQGPVGPATTKWGGFIRFGENPAPGTGPSDHTPATPAPRVNINWVEFTGLGNRLVEGEYPIHFHYGGAMAVGRIGASSFHHNYNRSIVVHHTTNVQLTDNVSYHTYGHAFYFASGLEKGCTLTGNLGLSTLAAEDGVVDPKDPTGQTILKPLNKRDKAPSTFWIKTLDCTVDNNISAGSEGTGFWIENPHEVFSYQGIEPLPVPNGVPFGPALPAPNTNTPTPKWSFDGNLAHSSVEHGYFGDHQVIQWGQAANHAFKVDGFTAYKCGQYGIFSRNFGHVLWENLRVADCQVGLYAASIAFPGSDGEAVTTFKDSLVIGESLNTGTIASGWDVEEIFAGRSLSTISLEMNLYPNGGVWGFEVYDGQVTVDDVEFVNFNTHQVASGGIPRKAAAIINRLQKIEYNTDPRNMMIGASFTNVPMKNRVFFRTGLPGANAVNHAVLWNPDGSVTSFGAPGQSGPAGYITTDQPAMLHTGASKTGTPGLDDAIWDADWNAWRVPDLPRSATESGRGIVQMLFWDKNGTHGSGSNGVAAFMRLTRVVPGGGPAPFIDSHHIHDAAESFFSNLYPFNIKQGEVYEVTPPTPTVGPGTPIDFENFNIVMRFCRPGDWVTLKIPMILSVPMMPNEYKPKTSASSFDFLSFFLHQRMDCLDYFGPMSGGKVPKLGNYIDPEKKPIPIVYERLSQQLSITSKENAISPDSAVGLLGAALGESTSPPTMAPTTNGGVVSTSPYGLAWDYVPYGNGNGDLYLRIVLMDYSVTGPYSTFNPPGAWFIPKGFAVPGVDVMFEGGAVTVHVKNVQ